MAANIRGAVIRHPLTAGAAALLFTGLVVFVLVYFEPQALLIDRHVNEPLPVPTASTAARLEAAARAGKPAAPPRLRTLERGRFTSYEHSTSGTASVIRVSDGSRYLRFERFETANGPDVRVFLSTAAASGPGDAFDDDYVELGHLKGNVGSQNYAIPPSLDLGRYRSAVIWCKRFHVAFGAAPLS